MPNHSYNTGCSWMVKRLPCFYNFFVNKRLKHFRISISWLIVGIYATIYVGWDVMHAHVHQEAAVSHSSRTEKDPCHRSIFHGESDAHKSHLTVFKYCASCHVVSQPSAFNEAIIFVHDYPAVLQNPADHYNFIAQQVVSLFSPRAPPFIV